MASNQKRKPFRTRMKNVVTAATLAAALLSSGCSVLLENTIYGAKSRLEEIHKIRDQKKKVRSLLEATKYDKGTCFEACSYRRKQAAKALAELKDEKSILTLIGALKGKDSEIEFAAFKALLEIVSKNHQHPTVRKVIPEILLAFKETNDHNTQGTHDMLSKAGRSIFPVVKESLKNADQKKKVALAWWVEYLIKKKYGAEEKPKIQKPKEIKPQTVKKELKINASEVVRQLQEALKKRDYYKQANLAGQIYLVARKDPKEPELTKAIPLLERVMSTYPYYHPGSLWGAKYSSAEALAEIGKPAIPALLRVLKDQRGWTGRSNAAKALEKIGFANLKLSDQVLVLCVKDFHTAPIENSVEKLVKLGKPAIPALIKASKDILWDVRLNASEAVSRIGLNDKELLHVAWSLKQSKKWSTRAGAALVLGQAGGRKYSRLIVKALRDPRMEVQEGAAYGLRFTKDIRAVAPLLRALNKRSPKVWKKAPDTWELRMFAGDSLIEVLRANPGNTKLVIKAVRALVKNMVNDDYNGKEGAGCLIQDLAKANAGNRKLESELVSLRKKVEKQKFTWVSDFIKEAIDELNKPSA
jgi:HEAT repeat protein